MTLQDKVVEFTITSLRLIHVKIVQNENKDFLPSLLMFQIEEHERKLKEQEQYSDTTSLHLKVQVMSRLQSFLLSSSSSCV